MAKSPIKIGLEKNTMAVRALSRVDLTVTPSVLTIITPAMFLMSVILLRTSSSSQLTGMVFGLLAMVGISETEGGSGVGLSFY